jgi:asparagine synthase (glutamine-hydrolysing)
MCGISGVSALVNQLQEKDVHTVEQMTSLLGHRGPDAKGFTKAEDCCFGFARLSILDFEGGMQPIVSHCTGFEIMVVCNGEVYNHKSIRERLKKLGHIFRSSHSDTEVIAHAYEEWGEDSFEYLEGMYAVAIWDPRSSSLILMRDRMGEKPLYFFREAGKIYFSSELRSLIKIPQLTTGKTWDQQNLSKYLLRGFGGNIGTIFKSVEKVPPSSYIKFSRNQFVESDFVSYYSFAPSNVDTTSKIIAHGELKDQIFNGLKESVEQQLNADAPLGLLLSGGLDSSVIAALASKIQPNIECFTAYFDENDFDFVRAQSLSTYLGLNLKSIRICDDDVNDVAERICNFIDEPIDDLSIIPTSLVLGAASKSVRVVLGGDGSDELFFGYDNYMKALKLHYLQQIPGLSLSLIKLCESFPIFNSRLNRVSQLLRKMSSPEEFLSSLLGSQLPAGMPKINLEFNKSTHNDISSFMDDLRLNYLNTYLSNNILPKTDIASMSHSVEYRSPFLSKKMADLAKEMNYKSLVSPFDRKITLKETFQDLFPKGHLVRKKVGFGVPLPRLMSGKFGENIRFHLMQHGDIADRIPRTLVHKIVSQNAKDGSNNQFLWRLYVLAKYENSYF